MSFHDTILCMRRNKKKQWIFDDTMEVMSDPILAQLNPAQKRAVTAYTGPFLVLAGAGSGKTTALTRRIAYLVRHYGVSAGQILAVTFTNKAAEQMRDRVATLLGAGASRPWVGTFHSTCVRILRVHASLLGYDQNFTILDAGDQLALVKRVMKELDIAPTQFPPRGMMESISRAKNNLIAPEAFATQVDGYRDEHVARIYERYQYTLRTNHSMDFDDLIRLTIVLFQQHPDVLCAYEDRWRFVLVDEYQDTNYAQYQLIRLLTQTHRNIFVVGDDWQSIYKWRGADVHNILRFEKDFPGTTVIALEQNYRSPQNVLDAAYGIIAQATQRTDKHIWSDNGAGKRLMVYEAEDELDEAAFVLTTMQQLMAQEGYRERDFVVLYRVNAQARVMEELLMREGVPYRVVGGIKFYERKEVRDLLAYVRLVANPSDVSALERVLTAPKRSIGPKTMGAWLAAARHAGMDPITFGADARAQQTLPRAKCAVIAQLCTMIVQARTYAETHTVAELLAHLYTASGYKAFLADGTEEGVVRQENITELYSSVLAQARGMEGVMVFLEHSALASDADAIDEESGRVHLMTLHSVKGLEFPVVFVIGMEEGLLPHGRAMANDDEMEEERRLAYVGVTRAKKQVFFVHARQRVLFGSAQVNMPSRFYDDMPKHLLEDVHPKKHARLVYTPTTVAPAESGALHTQQTFRDGDAVEHPQFGVGVVVGQTDTIIHVVFRNVGLKKLARGIAPLVRR